MKIGGLTPFTSIDFPDALAAVLFCQGCPWRCGYCHNPHLQPFAHDHVIPWEHIIDFLKMRQGFLEAVVLSGGEPTVQKDLVPAMQEIRSLGYKIGLHTAGMHPLALKAALPFCDWIGMDIKAPFDLYERITRIPKSGETAETSARQVIESSIPYEFRTTVHPDLLSPADLRRLVEQLIAMGAKHYALQHFRPLGCNDPGLAHVTDQGAFNEIFTEELKSSFQTFLIRD